MADVNANCAEEAVDGLLVDDEFSALQLSCVHAAKAAMPSALHLVDEATRWYPVVLATLLVAGGAVVRGMCGRLPMTWCCDQTAAARLFVYLSAFVVLGMVHSIGIPVSLGVAKLAGGGAVLSGVLTGMVNAGVPMGLYIFSYLRSRHKTQVDKMMSVGVVFAFLGSLVYALSIWTGSPRIWVLLAACLLQGVGTGFVDLSGEVWLSRLMPTDGKGAEHVFLMFYIFLFFGQEVVGFLAGTIVHRLGLFTAMPALSRSMMLMTLICAALLGAQLVFMPCECDTVLKDAEDDKMPEDSEEETPSEDKRCMYVFWAAAFMETFVMTATTSAVECANTYILEVSLGWSTERVGLMTGLAGMGIFLGTAAQTQFQDRLSVRSRVRSMLCMQALAVIVFSLPIQNAPLDACTLISSALFYFSLYPRHAITESSMLAARIYNPEWRALMLLHAIYVAYTVAPPLTRWIIKEGGSFAIAVTHLCLWLCSCSLYEIFMLDYLVRVEAIQEAKQPGTSEALPSASVTIKPVLSCGDLGSKRSRTASFELRTRANSF